MTDLSMSAAVAAVRVSRGEDMNGVTDRLDCVCHWRSKLTPKGRCPVAGPVASRTAFH